MGILIIALTGLAISIWTGLLIAFSKNLRKEAARSAKHRKPVNIQIFINIIISVILLGCATASAFHSLNFVRTAVRTKGKIIQFRKRNDRHNQIVYSPVVSFHDASGAEHSAKSDFYNSPVTNEIGDPLTVLYQSQNPEDAKIDNDEEIWSRAKTLAVFGLFFLAVVLITLFWRHVTQQSRQPMKNLSTG
jgi:succinate dehydrogenase/fumarate reductase cytochrome b subunit